MRIIKKLKNTRRGDTIIEVTIAFTIFCLISLLTVSLMDQNLATIQGSLELTMARNEIDAQAEALRFIQNSYLTEREYEGAEQEYQKLWKTLTNPTDGGYDVGLSNLPASVSPYPANECSVYYNKDDVTEPTNSSEPHSLFKDHAFIINTRAISKGREYNSGNNSYREHIEPSNVLIPSMTNGTNPGEIGAIPNPTTFTETSLYPRVIFESSSGSSSGDSDKMLEQEVYDKIARAEGIWVISVRDCTVSSGAASSATCNNDDVPEFYDFHIRTCWFAPSRSLPSTIATIVRLYNPDSKEAAR